MFVRLFPPIPLPPTENPSRLKVMPQGVGSISTPADVLSGFFEISNFHFVGGHGVLKMLGRGVLIILGLGVLNRTWGPQHF